MQIVFQIIVVIVGVLSIVDRLAAEEVYFRHDFGVADIASPPPQFDDSTTIWKVPLERGHSTPTISGDSIYVTTFDNATKKHSTICLDRKTGKEQWRRNAPTDYVEPQHSVGCPASATVATDGQRVYSCFGSYGVLCYTMDGMPVWSKPLAPVQDEYGSSSSPILVEGKLLLNEDHDINSFLIAIDATNGKTIWKVNRDDFTRGYATPTVWKHNGKTEIIVAGALQLTSYDLETGKKLWWVNGLARMVNTTPVVHDDQIVVATWSPGGDVGRRISLDRWSKAKKDFDKNNDNKITRAELKPGAALTRFFRIDLDQDEGLDENEWTRHLTVFEQAQNFVLAIHPRSTGDITKSAVVWKTSTGVPFVSSPLVHEDVVYLVKDGGIFTTINADSGELLKRGRLRGRGNYYSSPVVASSKVYIASQNGILSIVTTGGEWSTVTTHDFREGIYATPVFDRDRLFIRTVRSLYCFGSCFGSQNDL